MTEKTEKSLTVGGMKLKGFDDAYALAERLAKSSMVPQAMRNNAGDVLAAILMGHEVGMSPMQALTGIAVINGKPSMYGDALLGLVQASGMMEYIKEDNVADIRKNQAATCETKRKGKPSYKVSFTMDDAKRAGLPQRSGSTGVWAKYPERMLQMRARSWCLRDQYADVLKGLLFREEVEDYALETTAEPIKEPKRPEPAAQPANAPQAKTDVKQAAGDAKAPETKPEPPPNTTESSKQPDLLPPGPSFEGIVESVRCTKNGQIFTVQLAGGEPFKSRQKAFAEIAKQAETAKKPVVITPFKPEEQNIGGFLVIKTIVIKS